MLRLLLLVACLALAPAAAAHDSPGGHHAWLPPEAWVYEHWLPFDEARLERALGLRGRQLEAYLFDDHHTLADLARRRGLDVAALADHLVEPWAPPLAPDRLAALRERTMRVLTHGHLAQHMFFHVFHSFGMGPDVARELFGVSERRLQHLRTRGSTPLAIARRHGTSRRRLLAGLADVLRARHRAALATGEAWPAASDRLLARQLDLLPCWIRSPRPSADAGNPYGKATLQHGVHPAGWPSTPAQRRADERRTERVRRSLERTCWPRVPAWRWRPEQPRDSVAVRSCTMPHPPGDPLQVVMPDLLRLYSPDAAERWLVGGNPHLGDRRPIDLIRSGRTRDVLDAIAVERACGSA